MRLLILTTAIVCMTTAILHADEHFVSLSGTNDTTGGYTNWAGAATQIQWAVNAAASGEKVWVSNGTYCVTNQIAVANLITVQSVHGYSNTTVYADWPAYTTRCFFVSNAIVDGFTVTNGHNYANNGSRGGGASIVSNSIMRNCYFTKNVNNEGTWGSGGGGAHVGPGCIMSNCWFVANRSEWAPASWRGMGGGVFVDSGQLFNSTVISNTSQWDGGGACVWGGIVSNCNISFNIATFPAGGVYLSGATMIDCVISNNQARDANYCDGGGIAGNGNIINCTIVNNFAEGNINENGGGICFNGASYVSNCIIANNIAKGSGGGLHAYNSVFTLYNCLIYGNTAVADGGGVFLGTCYNCTIVSNSAGGYGGGVSDGSTSVNCIVYFNTATTDGSNWYGTVSFTNSCTAPDPGGVGNITGNPMFVDTNTANYRLSVNSPGINTGANQDWMTNSFDLDGRRRIDRLSGRVDMGAYEFIHKITLFSGH